MNTPMLRIIFPALVTALSGAVAFSQVPQEPWLSGYSHGVAGVDDPNSNPAALTDGTPVSTTSIVAADNANAALVNPDVIIEDFSSTSSTPQAGTSTAGIDAGMGSYKINGNKADLYTVTLPYSLRINDRGTLQTSLPFTMTNYKNVLRRDGTMGKASVYGEGLNIGWCYRVFDKQDHVNYRWKVTPTAGLYRRGSGDLNMGSWVYNVGFSSSFAWQLSNGWIANVGNSITMAWNNGLSGYPDPIRDQQQVLINGVQVYKFIDRWVVGGMVIDTRYFRSNLIDSFQTYAVTAGYKITPTRSLRFSVVVDNGKGFSSVRGTLGSSWQF